MANTVRQALLQLFDRANDLKALPRTGWLLAGVAAPESLADHTCGVALYALFLAEAINADFAGQGLAAPLDVEEVMALALIHDLAESVLTDLPRRSAQLLGERAKHEAEGRVMEQIVAGLPNGERYRALWHSYATVATPEARLIKDVDKLEMVVQAVHYARRGHRNLHEFWAGHGWHYPLCRAMYGDIVRQVEAGVT
jgi:putative hydrolase of HD superfamily